MTPARPSLTAVQKLTIMVRYCRCPRCGGALGRMDDVEFDHIHPRALGGADALDNYAPLHRVCHAEKTTGRRGASKLSSAGAGDVSRIAKAKRLDTDNEAYRSRLLAKEPGAARPRSSRWPSRRFPKRKKG